MVTDSSRLHVCLPTRRTSTPLLAPVLGLLLLGAPAWGSEQGAAMSSPAGETVPAEDGLSGSGVAETPTALYPLWENTGHVLRHGRVFLGTGAMEVGLLDRLQVGVRPTSFLFRTPNLHAKVQLLKQERLAVAAHAEALVLLPGASESFTSSNYVSRVDTRDAALVAVPVGATASFAPVPWLQLHGTATVLGTLANRTYEGGATVGASVVAELLAHPHHALSLHAGEVGFWAHDFALVGADYRYRLPWLELRAGYFYRLTPEGAQASPLVSVGFYL